MNRSIFIITLCLIVLLVQVPFSTASAANNQNGARHSVPEGYRLASENDSIALFYREDKAQIAVMDKRTGKLWHSSLPEDQRPASNVNEDILKEFDSIAILTYTMLNKVSSGTTTSSLESFDYDLEPEVTSNGVKYVIKIGELNLKFEISLELDSYGLNVSIPSGGIVEGDGTERQVAKKVQAISEFIDTTVAMIAQMQADSRIPPGDRKDLKSAVKELDNLKEYLAGIKTAISIEQESEKILEDLNRIEDLLVGSASHPGFFSGIATSSVIDSGLKSEYRSKQKDFGDAIMPVKITATSLKTVAVGSLVEVDVLPYFGACSDHVEGYMVYPNGCGAVTEFKEKHGQYATNFKTAAYSDQTPDIDWEQSIDNAGLKRTLVPYFGVKQAESGFAAYVSQGRGESAITFSPSGYIFNVNRINAGFTYRKTIAVQNSGGKWQAGQQPTAYETNRSQFDASLVYMFLAGGESDYSGMAGALRKYLTDKGVLMQNAILTRGQMPLALELFGGCVQKVLIFNNYITGTTFAEASQMVDEISNGADIPLMVNFVGYAENGYSNYPSKTKAAPQLGSIGDLKQLSGRLAKQGGRLFLQDNHALVLYNNKGYSEGELALGTNLRVISSADKTKYLLTPGKVLENVKSAYIPFARETEAFGMTEDMIGSFVYYDYSSKNFTPRNRTIDIWQQTLQAVKQGVGGVAVTGGNDYTFPYADWIMNVPSETSGYIYTDYGIPFYQMLIHGFIPYTSEPVNQYYDSEYQFLKSVEYGDLPYFRLSYNPVDANETGLYVSSYDSFHDDIVDVYNAFSKDLTGVIDKRMVSHEINGDIVTVTYSDGTRIVVNYGRNDAAADGKTVKPMSYSISRPTGGELIEKTETKAVPERRTFWVHLRDSLGGWLLPVLLVSLGLFAGARFRLRKRRSGNEA